MAPAEMTEGIGTVLTAHRAPMVGIRSGILALPAAILALIFGIQSVKGNANTKSIIGIITGSVTLVLFLIALAFFAAYMAALG